MITDVENLARDPFFTMGTIRNQPGGDEHDVYPAGQLLVDFENLSNGAVLPVGGECASVLELEAVLEDPLACGVECRDEFLRADDEDHVRGTPRVGGELASGGGSDHECSLDSYGPPPLIASWMPVSWSVAEVWVITDEPSGMRASTASRAASSSSMTWTLNPCSSSATTVDSSVALSGSVVNRSGALVLIGGPPRIQKMFWVSLALRGRAAARVRIRQWPVVASVAV
jgi:hypothetical protein